MTPFPYPVRRGQDNASPLFQQVGRRPSGRRTRKFVNRSVERQGDIGRLPLALEHERRSRKDFPGLEKQGEQKISQSSTVTWFDTARAHDQ